MKEKIMNNLSLKILAVVLAAIVWVIVNNVDDPVSRKTFKNIEVELQNEDAISSLDKVYEVKTGGIINVTVSGKQSVLRKLNASDIVAVADLSDLSITNATYIKLSCPKYENVNLSSDIRMLTISVEDEQTEQFKVDVKTVGTLSEGYALGEVKVRPNLIKVSGAKSQVERISEVRVEADVSNATDNFVKYLEPKAYDANGKLMDTANLTFSSEKVKVSVAVYETKTIPIEITTTGKPKTGYHVISVEYEPKEVEVMVTGSDEKLSSYKTIPIQYNIDGADKNIQTELSLSDYLPKGLQVVEEVSTINVLITISQQELQTIPLPVSSIDVRNLGKDYKLDFLDGNSIEVKAIWSNGGTNKEITSKDFSAYIDCTDLGVGEHTLNVQFVLNKDILIEAQISVRVNIPEKTQSSEIKKTIEPKATDEATQEPEVTEEPSDEKTDQDGEEER